jgi:glyoxylase-like metal-dependent hydrolase (beta-lactamase superfamily II)
VSHPFLDKTLYWEGYDSSSNVYAIAGESLTIIDPGNDYMALMELFRMGYKPKDVKKILLTHGHVEHVMGAFELFR